MRPRASVYVGAHFLRRLGVSRVPSASGGWRKDGASIVAVDQAGGTRLWRLVQDYLDRQPFPPSDRRLAQRVGVSPTTIGSWRRGELTQTPKVDNLDRLADLIGVPYRTVHRAAALDAGLRIEDPGSDVSSVSQRTG
jgi:transcriptional regulator with XRE-family HTH domain